MSLARTLSASALIVLPLVTSGCSKWERAQCVSARVSDFQGSNLYSHDFGLQAGELVLTFDDGPGPDSVPLARALALRKIPAVFFMLGKSAANNTEWVRQIAEMTVDGTPVHLIANHTWDHESIARGTTDAARWEVQKTDDVLSPFIRGTKFFRAPGGSFGGSTKADALNSYRNLKDYIGPVYWDIGGELTSRHAADWDCWARNLSVTECGSRYLNEATSRGKGIVLAHDTHTKTVDMFLGRNGAPALVDRLRDQGFRFVRLDAHPEALRRWGNPVTVASESPAVSDSDTQPVSPPPATAENSPTEADGTGTTPTAPDDEPTRRKAPSNPEKPLQCG